MTCDSQAAWPNGGTMTGSNIDLNLFTVFDAIYQGGGITAAGRRLHLSQPAVSHALRRLRELLGDPLFERKRNAMIPTPRARALAGTVRGCLESLERLSEHGACFEPTQATRRFRLALRHIHERSLLPSLYKRLHRRAPGIGVEVVRIERSTLDDDLQSGELDAAIDVELSMPPQIRRELLSSEPLVVLARKGHPQVRGALDLATYLSLDHVLVTGRRHGVGYEDAALGSVGIARRVRVRCQLHEAAHALVSKSDLIATMPRSHAELVNSDGSNQVLALPVDAPALRACLYWHRTYEADAANQWFRRQLRESWRAMRGTPVDATPKSQSASRRSRPGSPGRPSGK
jgi:DNA-binding transcriptional LysR family regulator